MSILAQTSYVIPLTTIYRQRVLSVPGRVLVRQGQKVAPQDILAQAILGSEHVLLDVGRGLRVPARKAEKFIDRVAGEQVAEGDVIATGPRGLVTRTVRAPCDGRIVYIRNGQVLLQKSTSPFELQAGYAGVVSELVPDRGAVIEVSGALVQCVWGNGKSDFGLMQLAAQDPRSILKPEKIEVSQRGAVIIGGYLEDAETLAVSADVPVRGLILASMSVRLVDLAMSMPFPILLTEGFGQLPMNLAAYRLLSTNINRDASVNADIYNTYDGRRPEVIIPLPISGKPISPPLPRIYAADQKIRLVRAPFASQVGTILAILPGLTAFPNGLRTPAADVRLETGERVIAPLANLEVLEYK